MGYSPEIQKLIDETNRAHEAQNGGERLWGWFSLSYASFLTLPRILMHAMPDDWQKRMAILLEEYNDAFPNQPDLETRVQCVRKNKLSKFPEWMLNYRRPDYSEIDKIRDKDPGRPVPHHGSGP